MRRRFFLYILLAALLLAGAARGETLLLFALAEDVPQADLTLMQREAGPCHAAVLQKANGKAQQAAREALAEAGVEEVSFLGLTSVKQNARTAERLQQKWGTADNRAKIASLLRRYEDDRLCYFSGEEEARRFLADFGGACAQAAADPTARDKKQKAEEYVRTVSVLRDGATGEDRPAPVPEESWREAWGDAGEPELPGLPATDEEGYLLSGEWVLQAPDSGLWAYLSDTLRIVIQRRSIKGLSWFEADIRRRPEGDTLHVVPSSNGKGADPTKIAQESRLVLGLNTDYYHYRISYKMKVGLVIRDGEVIRESAGETTGTGLPSLDTLLLDAAGGFRLDKAGLMDSETALALGARDVLAFGPILVKEGHVRMLMTKYRTKKEPRTAIGLLGENHYLAVVAEGRLKNSPGISLDSLGQLMAARGCTEAINLDGGHTSALIFLGERLNKIGNLSGTGTSAPRSMLELLGIGTWATQE